MGLDFKRACDCDLDGMLWWLMFQYTEILRRMTKYWKISKLCNERVENYYDLIALIAD